MKVNSRFLLEQVSVVVDLLVPGVDPAVQLQVGVGGGAGVDEAAVEGHQLAPGHLPGHEQSLPGPGDQGLRHPHLISTF